MNYGYNFDESFVTSLGKHGTFWDTFNGQNWTNPKPKKREIGGVYILQPLRRNWYLGGEFIAERERKQQAGPAGEERDWPSRDVGK
jgi:hypothetical protein